MFDQELNVDMVDMNVWNKSVGSSKFKVKFKKIEVLKDSSTTLDCSIDSIQSSINNSFVIQESLVPNADILFDGNIGDLNVPPSQDRNAQEVHFIQVDEFKEGYSFINGNCRCLICGFLSNEVVTVCSHILDQHGNDWRESIAKMLNKKRGNVHLYPNWDKELKRNFDELLISKCSEKTRIAWRSKEVIDDKESFISVRTEILSGLINHIVDVYGIVSTPTQSVIEESVVSLIKQGYPFMFSDVEGSASSNKKLNKGYGCGGAFGNKYLAKNLRDRISQKQSALRLAQMNSAVGSTEEEVTAPFKKGNRPHKYGK